MKAWKILCDISRKFFTKVYKRLDITNNEFGESYYKEMIPKIIQELKDKKLAVMDDGALCIFTKSKKK